MARFKKDKILGPNWWTNEFYIAILDLLGADLLTVVEETWIVYQANRDLERLAAKLVSSIQELWTLAPELS